MIFHDFSWAHGPLKSLRVARRDGICWIICRVLHAAGTSPNVGPRHKKRLSSEIHNSDLDLAPRISKTRPQPYFFHFQKKQSSRKFISGIGLHVFANESEIISFARIHGVELNITFGPFSSLVPMHLEIDMLVWNLSLRDFVRDMSFGNFCAGSFAWELWLAMFRFETFVWEFSPLNYHLKTFIWESSLRDFNLGTFAW